MASCSLDISREKTPTGRRRSPSPASCRVLGNVEGKGGFAHARPSCDDDEVRRLQAAGHLVEVGEARGHAGDAVYPRLRDSMVFMLSKTRSLMEKKEGLYFFSAIWKIILSASSMKVSTLVSTS